MMTQKTWFYHKVTLNLMNSSKYEPAIRARREDQLVVRRRCILLYKYSIFAIMNVS
jgi:hypothetical protein